LKAPFELFPSDFSDNGFAKYKAGFQGKKISSKARSARVSQNN